MADFNFDAHQQIFWAYYRKISHLVDSLKEVDYLHVHNSFGVCDIGMFSRKHRCNLLFSGHKLYCDNPFIDGLSNAEESVVRLTCLIEITNFFNDHNIKFPGYAIEVYAEPKAEALSIVHTSKLPRNEVLAIAELFPL